MSCIELKLQSVSNHIGYDNLANILEANLKTYYDWALLCIGGWTDVTKPTYAAYGGDYSRLRLVDDPAYNLGQVWEAPRKDFVWEYTGVQYVDPTGGTHSPIQVGIPLVNSVSTTQSYSINHPEGKIIFDTALPTSSVVELDYSYRYAQIYRADDVPWWRELQFNSHRIDSEQFQQLGSGVWSIFGSQRIQMPAIVIESVPRGTSRGWELGSNSKEASRDVLFHIFAENRGDRNNLMDIVNLQTDRKIFLFDTNAIMTDGAFPLNYQGELVNLNTYENLVSVTGYRWKTCLMDNSTITNINQIHPSLYTAVVRTTMSVIV